MNPATMIQLVNMGLQIANGVAKGVSTAMEAEALVKLMVAENRDPTAGEWAQLDAAADAAHAALQGA